MKILTHYDNFTQAAPGAATRRRQVYLDSSSEDLSGDLVLPGSDSTPVLRLVSRYRGGVAVCRPGWLPVLSHQGGSGC